MFNQLNSLTQRNFLCFIKDPRRVFFTFLSPLLATIIFLLFAQSLFNTDTYFAATFGALTKLNISDADKQALIGSVESQKVVNSFIDGSFCAGLIGVTTITTALSLCSVMVDDARKKVLNDLFITPVKGGVVRLSYLAFNFIITTFISVIILCFIFVYQSIRGTFYYSNLQAFKVLGLVILSCFINSAFFVFLISYVKSNNAFSAISAGISSVIGFFIGAFIPLSKLPVTLAEISSFMPGTQMVNAMKGILLPLSTHDSSLFENLIKFNEQHTHLPNQTLLKIFDISLNSISFNHLATKEVGELTNVLYPAIFGVIFLSLNFLIDFKKV